MSIFDRLVVTTLPLVPKFIVGKVAARYVAGENLDEAVRTIQQLNAEGACCTVDLLGEGEQADIEEPLFQTLSIELFLNLDPALIPTVIDQIRATTDLEKEEKRNIVGFSINALQCSFHTGA